MLVVVASLAEGLEVPRLMLTREATSEMVEDSGLQGEPRGAARRLTSELVMLQAFRLVRLRCVGSIRVGSGLMKITHLQNDCLRGQDQLVRQLLHEPEESLSNPLPLGVCDTGLVLGHGRLLTAVGFHLARGGDAGTIATKPRPVRLEPLRELRAGVLAARRPRLARCEPIKKNAC